MFFASPLSQIVGSYDLQVHGPLTILCKIPTLTTLTLTIKKKKRKEKDHHHKPLSKYFQHYYHTLLLIFKYTNSINKILIDINKIMVE